MSRLFSSPGAKIKPLNYFVSLSGALVFCSIFMLSFSGFDKLAAAELSPEQPVWLVKNNWKQVKGLPRNFRRLHDGGQNELGKSIGKGLDSVNASGSAQLSKDNFSAIKNALSAYKITVVDLRQEPHGFLNKELPVSWYEGQDQLNWGKSLSEIESDESKRIDELAQAKSVVIYDLGRPSNDPNASKIGIEPEKVEVSSACSEASICKAEHLPYIRIPVADYHHPADEYVDKFVKLQHTLVAGEWLHLHSGVDDGRTTMFLAMLDMMHNADKVSFGEIIERQQLLGGIDLLQVNAKQEKTVAYMEARSHFIREFYSYCVDQIPHKFASSWSEWKRGNVAVERK